MMDGNITRHPETHFLDFVVDGRSIREMVDGGPGHVTELCRPWLHAVPESVERLLGRLGTKACRRTASRSRSAECVAI